MSEREAHIVSTVDELESLFGAVGDASRRKEVPTLHAVYREWIALSPFAVLATCGPAGLDASPRGDPASLVRVVDERTLLLPERRGNNRVDSLRNIVADPRVALLFLIPGIGETLRVNGSARITTSPVLRAELAMNGVEPVCVVEVTIESVYFQCARALQRSRLWDAARDGTRPPAPSAGTILAALTECAIDGEQYDAALPARQRATLY